MTLRGLLSALWGTMHVATGAWVLLKMETSTLSKETVGRFLSGPRIERVMECQGKASVERGENHSQTQVLLVGKPRDLGRTWSLPVPSK